MRNIHDIKTPLFLSQANTSYNFPYKKLGDKQINSEAAL